MTTLVVGATGATGRLLVQQLLLLTLCLFALRLAQHTGVMFGMLQEGLFSHTVVRQLGITGQCQVFFDDLLRGAADLALRPRGIKYTIDNIAERTLTVRLRTRTGFR